MGIFPLKGRVPKDKNPLPEKGLPELEVAQPFSADSSLSPAQRSEENDQHPLPEPLPVEGSQSQPPEPLSVEEIVIEGAERVFDEREHAQLLLQEMQELRADFDVKVKYDESKERIINSLHEELQGYREGLHFKILRPILMDLISMHDDLGKILDVAARDQTLPSGVLSNLQSFQASIEEVLQRYEVELFHAEGESFLSGQQRILKAEDSSDPAQDRQIARRIRPGFRSGERVLRPELVHIFRFVHVVQGKDDNA